MPTHFADRLGNITIASGVARLDFIVLKEVDKDKQNAQFEPAFKLAMPIEGIMQTIDALDKMKEELLEQVKQHQVQEQAKKR